MSNAPGRLIITIYPQAHGQVETNSNFDLHLSRHRIARGGSSDLLGLDHPNWPTRDARVVWAEVLEALALKYRDQAFADQMKAKHENSKHARDDT